MPLYAEVASIQACGTRGLFVRVIFQDLLIVIRIAIAYFFKGGVAGNMSLCVYLLKEYGINQNIRTHTRKIFSNFNYEQINHIYMFYV